MMTEGSGATPAPAARGLPRSLVIIVFGPLLGALLAFAFFVVLNLIDPPSASELLEGILPMLIATVVAGWVTGLPGAVLSALIWHVIEPRLGAGWRLPAALIIGAVASITTSLPIIYTVFGSSFFGFNAYLLVGAIGAIAMACTALPRGKSA